jgi:NADH-quinone oxidoreductase subunit A
MNLQQYFPVLLFIIVATLIGFALLAGGRLLAPHKPDAEKLSAYECGFEAFGDSRMNFDVRYYLVAILFIMFDLEIAFLFPWAIANGAVGLVGFWTVIVFLAVLTVGFVYEWKKGALNWE